MIALDTDQVPIRLIYQVRQDLPLLPIAQRSSRAGFGDASCPLIIPPVKLVRAFRFDVQETLEGHYNVFHQILTDCGIPGMFQTDRRTVSEYKRKNNAFDDEDTFTQFSYACHQLDVEKKQLAQHKPKAV